MSATQSQARKKGSMSIASHGSKRTLKSKTIEREESIQKNIEKMFEDKKNRMTTSIIDTMIQSNFKQYKLIRKEGGYELQFGEIEKERNKIKRKKNKKERKKQLYTNSVEKMKLVVKLLNMCFKHYK